MLTLFSFALLALSIVLPAHASNRFPIILVHGFTGWGRDELNGFRYWGGLQGDFETKLNDQGYTVYTAAVGPFSSNWDRACELYAVIKGGQVDYGQIHSTTYNHFRFGRNYTGLYPQWGTTNSDGSINKVHLVGHSMGGQTIRMLAQMLAYGTTGAPTVEDRLSHPLFKGGKKWVHSITTISTPNQGTTLSDGFSVIGNSVKNLFAGLANVMGLVGDSVSLIYDAKMDQWNISPKKSNESISAYLDRVFSSPIFARGFRDISLWSLSTGGAKEEATWVTTLSDVYYYSYSNVDTFETLDILLRKVSLPNLFTMSLPLRPFGLFLGGRYATDQLHLSNAWQPNDGVVNTISMANDGIGTSVPFNGISLPGKWNEMPQLQQLDHLAIIGVTIRSQVLDLYTGHAALLYALPDRADSSRRLTDAPKAVAQLHAAISNLNAASTNLNTESNLALLCQNPANTYQQSYCANMINLRPHGVFKN
ncbi:hypothetical protein CCR75_007583 [Bremia lactucae]|uniref:Lipase-like C-terminal domain-containing protein n=1 Tax=Bremia lactucae TaxID=4779 RepID=A0A976FK58_BRELC|nr:hypothetical protein CCR75_007583 [Bremia lactucae]